ncbi:MAG: hypothetical protein JWM11_4744 [Planctomycetaceae bacterium]|nr:hypothetical protein [Planctomycetaceae bacterium]
MKRFHQCLLVGSFIPLCWLGMQVVHELGHIVAAIATGGRVAKVVLHPLAISRTDVDPNPEPLIVVWAGPLMGVLLPLLIWAASHFGRVPGTFLIRFFAGFCLMANGAYIGAGSLDGIGDAGDMQRHGTPLWLLWLFGICTVPAGFGCWNGLGPHFGFGKSKHCVDRRLAYLSFLLLVLSLLLASAFSPRS